MKALFIKVCGMRDALNIEKIAALSPRYMGFIFAPNSSRYVGEAFSSGITRSLREGITSVGVFQDQELATVVETLREYALGAAQLHGEEDARYLQALRRELPRVSLIKAVSVSTGLDLKKLEDVADSVDLFVFDNGRGGTGEAFDWDALRDYSGDVPFLLAGGIGLSNLETALASARRCDRCVGLDINSKFEVRPGLKDETQVEELLRRVRV